MAEPELQVVPDGIVMQYCILDHHKNPGNRQLVKFEHGTIVLDHLYISRHVPWGFRWRRSKLGRRVFWVRQGNS